jgi:hypothetical protein
MDYVNVWLTCHRDTGWTQQRLAGWFQSTGWLELP